MSFYTLFLQPFAEFDFMRRALAAVLFLSLGAAPVGVFVVLRRMSLMGDAISHALLPGIAAGYLLAGLNLAAMSAGGLVAGLLMALGVALASRSPLLKEDAHFAAFYLSALALGVLMLSRAGSRINLLHLLFGSVLAVDAPALALVGLVASISVVALALIYRPLLLEMADPVFLRATGGRGAVWHALFLMLVVLNLVAGFQALGTLMAVGLMMLPAISAQLWTARLGLMLLLSSLIALLCGTAGLLLSWHVDMPSGPAIVVLCGAFYLFSLLFAARGGWLPRWLAHRRHRQTAPVATPNQEETSP